MGSRRTAMVLARPSSSPSSTSPWARCCCVRSWSRSAPAESPNRPRPEESGPESGPARVDPGGPRPDRSRPPVYSRATMSDGTVIIIGGAEDKIRDRIILNRFVALAGGEDAVVVVISTASSLGTQAGERYRHIFTELGVKTIRPLH